jgi:hypothetical protein
MAYQTSGSEVSSASLTALAERETMSGFVLTLTTAARVGLSALEETR